MVRRVMVILITAVSLKPDSAFASGACTLIEGTSESQHGKQVVFNMHNIEAKGEMDCSGDYAKYSTNKMAEMALAAFALIATMNSGFGYAMGEIPAGVQLDYFYRVEKEPVLILIHPGAPNIWVSDLVLQSLPNLRGLGHLFMVTPASIRTRAA